MGRKSLEMGAVAARPGPYRIQVAAALAGTPPTTLRAWERRYGVPVPRRTASAYRLYSAEDVAQVRRMSELVAEGLPPSDAARTVLAGADAGSELGATETTDPRDVARERILSAVARWDGEAIDAELARISYLLSPQSLFSGVLSPLLVAVGERWERGQLSVAQEHLLSEKVEHLLRGQLRTLARPDGPLLLAACVAGEEHVLGLLGAALGFAANGWRIVVLGAATPPDAIGDAIRTMKPRLVGLSVMRSDARVRASFRQYARAIGSRPWVVGGRATEGIAAAVEAAGGRIALPLGPAWNGQLREWLHERPRRRAP